jgi:hypothetical protein
MYETIRQAIAKILEDSNLFEKVSDFEVSQLYAFPMACVSASSHNATNSAFSVIGSPAQQQTYTFTIRAYFNIVQSTTSSEDGQGDVTIIENEARKEAEDKIIELTDQMIELFARNRTLNESCSYASPISSRIGEMERNMIVKYGEITVQAVVNQRYV